MVERIVKTEDLKNDEFAKKIIDEMKEELLNKENIEIIFNSEYSKDSTSITMQIIR